MDFNTFYDAIDHVLNEVDERTLKSNRELYEKQQLDNLHLYTKHLDKIPDEMYFEVAVDLLQLIYDYNFSVRVYKESLKPLQDIHTDYWEKHGVKRYDPGPMRKKDLKTAIAYKNLLNRLQPKESGQSHDLLDKLIDDLESDTYTIISKYSYHRHSVPNKTEIKAYLNSLSDDHNLNKRDTKELTDII